jgi:hypothetical protein
MVHALADYLRAEMTGIGQVLEEWPTANVNLVYPAISIVTQQCPLVPASVPRQTIGAISSVTHLAEVLHEVGAFEFKLQIDLWERTKPQRSALVAQFIDVFNKDIIPAGLRLCLTGYHNQYVTMFMGGNEFGDTGRGSQIQEWRATIAVEGSCAAVRVNPEYLIETPVLVNEEFSTDYVSAT